MNASACCKFFNADIALLVLRLWSGLTMLFLHGIGKIQNFETYAGQFMNFLGLGPKLSLILAIFGEVGCALLISLGLLTRLGALGLVITMGTAFFVAHDGKLTGERNGEMAFIYLAMYVTILIAGGGKYALDALLCRRCKDKATSQSS